MKRFLIGGPVASAVGSFLVAALLVLSGCVSGHPYQTDAAHPVRTLKISREVQMPEKMIFFGLSQSMAGIFGGAVGVLSTLYREGEQFDLPRALHDDLAAELTHNGRFKIVAAGPADAEIRIHVREYGFVEALGFMRRQVKPILTIDTAMVGPGGTELWKGGVIVNQKEKRTPATLPELLTKDPKLARDALHTAARIWAEKTAALLR